MTLKQCWSRVYQTHLGVMSLIHSMIAVTLPMDAPATRMAQLVLSTVTASMMTSMPRMLCFGQRVAMMLLAKETSSLRVAHSETTLMLANCYSTSLVKSTMRLLGSDHMANGTRMLSPKHI